MRRRWIWIALIVLVVGLIGVGVWILTPAEPMPEALEAMESNPVVMVSEEDWIVFQPVGQEIESGLILYPGGLINPRAYAPTARALAAEGYMVVIVPMPLNLAVLGANRAGDVIAAYPAIQEWAVGGHSLGGAMAARFAYQNLGQAEGLALWAAYPARGDDLSGQDIAVTSIYATNDGLTTQEDIEASRPLLPPDTAYYAIEGGNHAQFAWDGEQMGDNPATISIEEQQEQIVAATLHMLQTMSGE